MPLVDIPQETLDILSRNKLYDKEHPADTLLAILTKDRRWNIKTYLTPYQVKIKDNGQTIVEGDAVYTGTHIKSRKLLAEEILARINTRGYPHDELAVFILGVSVLDYEDYAHYTEK